MKALLAGILCVFLSLVQRAEGQEQPAPPTAPAPAASPGPASPSAPSVDGGVPTPPPPAATSVPPPVADAGAAPNASQTPVPAAPKGSSSYESAIVGAVPDPALIGASATVVTQDEVKALPGGENTPVTQLVTMQPGVVADSFGSNIHFRGNDGAVLYVLDGISLLSAPVGTVGQLLNIIPTRLVQNMEIFSGGFPVEYSYSLGGVVDIHTLRPSIHPAGELQLTYGSYNHLDVAVNYSQQIGKLGIVASANFLTVDRGLDTPDAVSILHDNRIGGSGFAKLTYEFNSSNRLELLGIYQQDKFQIPIDPTMQPLSAAPPGAVRGVDVYGNGPPPFVPYGANPTDSERTVFAALSYVHTGAVSGQASLYVREIYENFDCDPAGSLGATADPGTTCSKFTRDNFHFGATGNVSWKWLRGNTWKAGIQIDDAPSTLNYSVFTRNDNVPQGGADSTQTLSGGDSINTLTGGIYLQDKIEVGKFTIVPGFRYDLQNTNFGGSGVDNLFLNGPSARLGLSYAPVEAVVIHASVAYLWEAPTVFDAPVIAPVLNPSLAGQKLPLDLKPATTWAGEIGVTVHPTRHFAIGVDGWGRLMHNWLDHENIGNSALWAAFNWDEGRAYGADLFFKGEVVRFWNKKIVLDTFGNVSYQNAEQRNIDSLTYLFAPDDLTASKTWSVQDHVQFWTVNFGLVVHDAEKLNNLAVHLNYGDGFHTGVATNELVPEHLTIDLTASHTFQFPSRPTIAFDAFNLSNNIYAYRLGTAYFGNSQFAPLRHFDVRLIFHFG